MFVQEQITSDVEPDVSAGTTGLLDDQESSLESDQSVSVDSEPVEDDSVQFSSSDEPEVEASRLVDEKSFDPLFSSIDDEELKTDDFYSNINEQDIKELPTVARRMLHNFRLAYKQKQAELDASHARRVEKYSQREQQINSLERDFARRQAEFASIIDDPRIQESLKLEESELPEIMSEEGIQARINRGVAEAVRNVFQPMQEVSSQRRQESAYLDFLESHPEMKDPSFKREVAKMVGDRKSVGAPISTQDAYEIVRARKVVNEQRKRAETERRARADAARRVQRSSVSGSPDSAEIPPDVKKQGAASIAAWLQSNPEAAKAFSNNR
jgi:hypothetical protein|tara:strand:- start:1400 stop:2380 length:981 start_codon:yes stop_codon:yes gene_type:complete